MTQVLLPVNTLLNNSRYRSGAVPGQGGFGVVYLATHLDLQTQVAIKAADQADAGVRQAGLDEGRLLSRLHHPHLPHVTDYVIDAHHQQRKDRGGTSLAWGRRLAYEAQKAGRLAPVSLGLERMPRALGAKPARTYQDNSREVGKQIVDRRSCKPTFVEYAILNTSRRGYLHGQVQPFVTWLHIPEPQFGCLPGEEAIVQLYPDYQHRCYGDLFETWIE